MSGVPQNEAERRARLEEIRRARQAREGHAPPPGRVVSLEPVKLASSVTDERLSAEASQMTDALFGDEEGEEGEEGGGAEQQSEKLSSSGFFDNLFASSNSLPAPVMLNRQNTRTQFFDSLFESSNSLPAAAPPATKQTDVGTANNNAGTRNNSSNTQPPETESSHLNDLLEQTGDYEAPLFEPSAAELESLLEESGEYDVGVRPVDNFRAVEAKGLKLEAPGASNDSRKSERNLSKPEPAIPPKRKQRWKKGDKVEAVWMEDEVFYLAEILRYEGNDTYEVLFLEYGNTQKGTPLDFLRDLTPEEELRISSEKFSAKDLPDHEWRSLVRSIWQGMKMRDCEVDGQVFCNVFEGYSAVSWLVRSGLHMRISSRLAALRVFQRLLDDGELAPLEQGGSFFTDGGVLYMRVQKETSKSGPSVKGRMSSAAAVSSSSSSTPAPPPLLRTKTLAALQEEIAKEDPSSDDVEVSDDDDDDNFHTSESEDDDPEATSVLIAQMVLQRKKTLFSIPADRRRAEEERLRRALPTEEMQAPKVEAPMAPSRSPRSEKLFQEGGSEGRNSAESRSRTSPRPQPRSRPGLPDFQQPHVAPIIRPRTRTNEGKMESASMRTSPRGSSPHESPRSKGSSPVHSPRVPSPRVPSPRPEVAPSPPNKAPRAVSVGTGQAYPGRGLLLPNAAAASVRPVTSPAGSPRPQHRAAGVDISAPSSPRPVTSPRHPQTPPRRVQGERSMPNLPAPAEAPRSPRPSSPRREAPQAPVVPPAVRSHTPSTAPVAPPATAKAPDVRPPLQPSRGGPPGAVGGGGRPPAPQLRPHLPRPAANEGNGGNAAASSGWIMGVAIIGSSFVAQRPEQLSVVAGTQVTVLARPTRHWLVVAVGPSVGSIPVSCVKYFTRATSAGVPRSAGRGRRRQ